MRCTKRILPTVPEVEPMGSFTLMLTHTILSATDCGRRGDVADGGAPRDLGDALRLDESLSIPRSRRRWI